MNTAAEPAINKNRVKAAGQPLNHLVVLQKLSLLRAWKFWAILVWLVLTLALAIWWLIFGLRQLEHLSLLQEESAQILFRHQRMLLLEGATLIVLLLGGGLVLLWAVLREMQRSHSVRDFFATFTHEVKTSLASLRLQAESLQQDLQGHSTQPLFRRLVKDTVRLQLQLENSLFVSQDDVSQLLLEDVKLAEFIRQVCQSWPDLSIEIKGEAVVRADQRALDSVFKNLIQNSIIHGRAKSIQIQIQTPQTSFVEVLLSDDGRGFWGDRKRLGHRFFRHAPSSGTGVGLSIVSDLMKQQGGGLEFPEGTDRQEPGRDPQLGRDQKLGGAIPAGGSQSALSSSQAKPFQVRLKFKASEGVVQV